MWFGRRLHMPTLTLLLFAGGSVAGRAIADSPVQNVRPFFDVGYSRPVGFGAFDRGFGLGFGFEIERSHAVSALFRVDWSELRAEDPPPGYSYYSSVARLATYNWSLGLRIYAPGRRPCSRIPRCSSGRA